MAKLTMKAAAAAAISLLAAPILAETVMTLHLPNVDPQTILASIITAGPSSTSYFLACPTAAPDFAENDCGLGTGVTMVEGPKTFDYTVRENVATINCNVLNSMTASCTESYVDAYTEAGGDGKSTVTSTLLTDWKDWEITVTVTAGDTYAGAGAPAHTTATPTAGGLGTSTDADPVGQEPTGVSKTQASSGSSVEASQTTVAAASSSTAATSSQSTGGMPRVTGNAGVAGVAAVFGGVLML